MGNLAGGIVEEPANEGQPQTAAPVPHQEHDPPADDHAHCHHPSRFGCPTGRPVQVPRQGPHYGAEDTPTIQWEAGDQIEQGQPQVHRTQIEPQPGQGCEIQPFAAQPQDAKAQSQQKTGQGAGDGDEELGQRPVRLAANVGHAAKDKERNALDWNAPGQGDHTMRQLVDEYRGEKEDAGQHACGQVAWQAPTLITTGKIACGQRKCHQGKDDEPGIVYPHRDTKDLAHSQRAFHSYPPSTSKSTR